MNCESYCLTNHTYTLFFQDGDCGVGMRVRNVTCVQNDGKVVEDKYCLGNIPYSSNYNVTEIGAEKLERRHVCSIPCPGECQHTQWSSWSKCHIYCHEERPIGKKYIGVGSPLHPGLHRLSGFYFCPKMTYVHIAT